MGREIVKKIPSSTKSTHRTRSQHMTQRRKIKKHFYCTQRLHSANTISKKKTTKKTKNVLTAFMVFEIVFASKLCNYVSNDAISLSFQC